MRVLLAHVYFLAEDDRERKIMKPYPPLGLLSVSAYISQKGVEHEVFDGTFTDRREFRLKLETYRPDVVAFYCNLMTKVAVVQFMEEIRMKAPATKIVLGGPDIRYNAEEYLGCGADVAVIGEGEESFSEVLEAFASGSDLVHIHGIAFRRDKEVIKNPARPLLRNIDELPSPALDKVDIEKYMSAWKSHHSQSMLSVSTQRGCPYTCKWCSTAVYGQTYRRKSPARTVDEVADLQHKYAPDAIWFVDDVFTISHNWMKSFVDELRERKIVLKYECITRADRLNKEIIDLLKESGCFRVWIGAESGSQRILDAMDRRVDAGYVRDMIIMAKAAGIETGTFIMLGYPGETEEDIQKTVEHLIESDPDYFTITLAYPIKGTALYQEVEAIQTRIIDWKKVSDRERDFQRTYNRKFYEYALRKVVNEVNFSKLRKKKAPGLKRLKSYVKSFGAKAMMTFHS